MAFFAIAALLCHTAFAVATQPNFLFILTDDQDVHMQSVQHMPLLQQYLVSEGVTFSRHYCSVALCCPARATIWTGRAAHNTNVTDVNPPYGGYPKVLEVGINDWYLPIWMQNAGYNTYYTGKIWNAHSTTNYDHPFVNGFNGSDFLLDPNTYRYYNATMTRNGAAPETYENQYSVDVVAEKAYGFLDEAANQTQPFLLVAAPIAPHSDVVIGTDSSVIRAPKYADRHADLFQNYTIPRDPSFNPAQQGGADWIADLPLLNDTVIAYGDEYQRARLRALQAVDDMVEGLVTRLDSKGLLNNTYIIYTTDNGFHIGQHRMLPGKSCGYETDINVPLIVRGPGIAKNETMATISSHADFAPTIMSLAGQQTDEYEFDGVPLPLYPGFTNSTKQENVEVEHWGRIPDEGMYSYPADVLSSTNTYKSVRVIGQGYSLYYSVWCTNEKEYYDMETDPWQLTNLLRNSSSVAASNYTIEGRPFSAVLDRVDVLLMVMKSCKGKYCIQPWSLLHPAGNVKTLGEALDQQYDEFYATQPKASFTECEDGYILSAEGPQNVNTYTGNVSARAVYMWE